MRIKKRKICGAGYRVRSFLVMRSTINVINYRYFSFLFLFVLFIYFHFSSILFLVITSSILHFPFLTPLLRVGTQEKKNHLISKIMCHVFLFNAFLSLMVLLPNIIAINLKRNAMYKGWGNEMLYLHRKPYLCTSFFAVFYFCHLPIVLRRLNNFKSKM